MEQQGNIGSVGSESVEATVASEKATAQVALGPVKISLAVEIDNKALLDLLVSRLPAGVAQTLGKEVENALFGLATAVAAEAVTPA